MAMSQAQRKSLTEDIQRRLSFLVLGSINTFRKNDRSFSYDVSPTSESPFLVTVINLYSYFFVFPYRVVYSIDNEAYELETSSPRKVFCVLLQLSSTIAILLFTCPMVEYFLLFRTSITMLFLIIYTITFVTGTLLVFKLSWFNKQEIVTLCNMTAVIPLSDNGRRLRFYKFLIISWTLIFIVVHILQGICSPPRVICAKRAHLILDPYVTSVFEYMGITPLKLPRDLLGDSAVDSIGVYLFSYLCGFIHLPIHMFLVLTLTMRYHVTDGLEAAIQDDSDDDEVLLQFGKVTIALNQLEETFAPLILCYYIQGMSFYAQLPQFFMYPGQPLIENVQFYNYLATIGVSLYLASGIHVKVKFGMLKYIEQSYEGNEHNESLAEMGLLCRKFQIMALLYSLRSATTGISCELFAITRSFLRGTIGIFATYALIVVQMLATHMT